MAAALVGPWRFNGRRLRPTGAASVVILLPIQALLRHEIRQRAGHFIDAFRPIVVAQFWIAAFSATCTPLFLLVAAPLYYAYAKKELLALNLV